MFALQRQKLLAKLLKNIATPCQCQYDYVGVDYNHDNHNQYVFIFLKRKMNLFKKRITEEENRVALM